MEPGGAAPDRVYFDYAGFSPVDPRVLAVMRPFLEAGIACSQERGDTVAVIQHRGVYPNVLIGAELIANCLILGNFRTP